MSELANRHQFRTLLKCSKCSADGHAVWEENSGISPDGPMGKLIRMSQNFVLQAPRNPQGQPVIACVACGTIHPD